MNNKQSIKPLTSLRGIGALWVYIYHCHFLTSSSPFFNKLAKSGYLGVDIFFILSGFIISYVHLSEFSSLKELKKNLKEFFLLRIARIYPVHIFTLLLMVILQFSGVLNSVLNTTEGLIHNIFLTESWGGVKINTWNIPAWSISVEFLLYLIFPFFALFIASKAKDVLSNILMILLCCSFWMVYFYATGLNLSYMHEPGFSVPRGILGFVIGISLYNLFRLKFLEKLPWDIISVLTIFGFIFVVYLKSNNSTVHDIYVIILCIIMVYSFANIKTFGHYLFSNRVSLYLGNISYSLYMFHFIYLVVMAKYNKYYFDEYSFFTWQFVVLTLGLIGVSSLSFYLIENPSRKWIRNLLKLPKKSRHVINKIIILFIILALFTAISSIMYNGIKADKVEVIPVKSAEIPALETKAKQGDAPSQYNLGARYYSGNGVEKDYELAMKWFTKSAKQGNLPSYYSLGNLYSNGQGVDKDQKKAAYYYAKAAEGGFKDAQFTLGYLYSNGVYFTKNLQEAYFWLALSAKSGDKNYIKLFKEVELQLTKAQIGKIKKQVEEWKPKMN